MRNWIVRTAQVMLAAAFSWTLVSAQQPALSKVEGPAASVT